MHQKAGSRSRLKGKAVLAWLPLHSVEGGQSPSFSREMISVVTQSQFLNHFLTFHHDPNFKKVKHLYIYVLNMI